jgi:sugar/nucleoside kinase (ribokinase family)|tara:strand:+ start:1055 stop:2050 length:996 start_codon:yes stop_codon:yes gene_type:complete
MTEDYSNKNVSILNVGNVLVDIEIKITDEDLSNLPVKKGGAIDINLDELNYFLKKYKSQITNKYLGGSVFSTAATSSVFNVTNSFLGSVGKDSNSKFLIDVMNTYPVKTYLNVDFRETGCCLIFLTPDKERSMAAYSGASSQLTLANLDEIDQIDLIFTDLYSLNSEINKKTIDHLLKLNNKLILSLSDVSVMKKHFDFIKKYTDQIFLVAGNEKEMSFLEQSMPFSFKETSLTNNKIYLITKGEKGSSVFYKGNEVYSSAIDSSVKSLNGAGDTFLGAFIGNYLETNDLQASSDVANFFSHVSVESFEACLPYSKLMQTKNAAIAASFEN